MIGHRTFRPLAAALTMAVSAAPLAAQDATVRDFDRYVARAVQEWRVPGLSVAVVQGDSVLLAKGYGLREVGRPDAVGAGTRFAIGSTTKAMTVVALAMLVDEGKVKWDERVITYLPSFRLADPYVTRELTVRDLLTHRAGLGNADMLWASAQYPRDEVLRRIGNLPPSYSLRSGFIYQNIMYATAGEVVAAVSGMPWEQFVRTRIFAPLGMTATRATLAEVEGQPDVASPHATVDDTLRVIPNRTVDPVAAAGSVWSSARDMAAWMRFVLDSGRFGGRRLLSAASHREMLTPQVIAPQATYPALRLSRPHFFTYGLGWFLHDYAGEAVAMHTGSIDGMSAIVGLIPERRLGIVVLANSDHAELRHALMYRAFDVFARRDPSPRDWSAELRTMFDSLETSRLAAERAREGRRAKGTRPSLPLERYAGTYVNPTFGAVVVTHRDGALAVDFGRRYTGTLEHLEYDSFRARWNVRHASPAVVVFVGDGAGNVSTVRVLGTTFTREQPR